MTKPKTATKKTNTKPKTTTKKVNTKPKSKASSKHKVDGVSAAAEATFWAIIEGAWSSEGKEVNEAREALSERMPGKDWRMEAQLTLVDTALDDRVIPRIQQALEALSKEDLLVFDLVLERKLYDIDRYELLCFTDDDDNFLGARGHIVGLGKRFYDVVNADPEMALCQYDCIAMADLPEKVFTKRFGKYPGTGSKISRESESNEAGWEDIDPPHPR